MASAALGSSRRTWLPPTERPDSTMPQMICREFSAYSRSENGHGIGYGDYVKKFLAGRSQRCRSSDHNGLQVRRGSEHQSCAVICGSVS